MHFSLLVLCKRTVRLEVQAGRSLLHVFMQSVRAMAIFQWVSCLQVVLVDGAVSLED